jgi:hypothetical protein
MAVNLIGKTFHRLTVLQELEKRNGRRRILCECACGEVKEFWAGNVTSGKSLSCGCLRDAIMSEIGKSNTTHGQSSNETAEYRAWRSMIQRCHSPSHKQYALYGGRGIYVCDRWRKSFEAFFADMGKRHSPKHSLDRIDNDKGYAPGNCRWATQQTQSNNRGSNNFVDVDGQRMTLAEAIRLKGQRSNVVRQRLALGWTLERALNEEIVPRASRGRKKHENKSARACRTG